MSAAEWIVDAALAITVAELAFVVLRRPRTSARSERIGLVANVGAGLLLMLAVRAAIVGAAWPWLAACLAGAGIAHWIDMRASSRRDRRST